MSIISRVAKKFGDKPNSNSYKFSEIDAFTQESSWVSSGSPSLDLNLKTFGFPNGIIEVRGESQSGKTTQSLQTMLTCQTTYKDKAVVTILSSERRDNKAYARKIGVNTEEILVHKVACIEDVQNKIFQTVSEANDAYREELIDEILAENKLLKGRTGDKIEELLAKKKSEGDRLKFFFIWDALGQTVSHQEMNKAIDNAKKNERGQAALGSAARSLGGLLRTVVGLLDSENVTLFIINRPYDAVDGTPGKKSYGGKAIMLYPTMRLEMSRIQAIKIGEVEVGQKTEIKTIKNDFDNPKQKFHVEIGYGLGYILNDQDIEIGIRHKILEKVGQNGAKFKMGNKELKWTFRKDLYVIYERRDPMLKILLKKLTEAAHKDVLAYRKAKDNDE